jgi:hypothetical protein
LQNSPVQPNGTSQHQSKNEFDQSNRHDRYGICAD